MFDKRRIVLIACLLLGVLGISFHIGMPTQKSGELLIHEPNTVVNSESSINELTNKKKSSKVRVQLSGAVNNPGVYELEKGSRVEELLVLAGGVSEDADLNKLNTAKVLRDGMLINIAALKGVKATNTVVKNTNKNTKTTAVDINTANSAELEGLPYIGKVLAERIVEYREINGPFKSKRDLLKVKGIGQNLLDKIKDQITL